MHSLKKLVQRNIFSKKHVFPKYSFSNKPPKQTSKNPFLFSLKLLTVLGIAAGSTYFLHSSEVLKSIANEFVDDTNNNVELKKVSKQADEDSPRKRFSFVNKVVTKCAPGVFHILVQDAKTDKLDNPTPFVYGSGFVITQDGLALTNAHVVLNRASEIYCKMSDGTLYKAKVLDVDANIDIALLQLVTTKRLTPLPLESPGDINVGEWVVALGSPLSLSNSVSVGVVSSVDRPAKDLGLTNYSMSYIQTDALITFGNSGGPLVNLDGNVVGISSLRLTSGIAFAIPIEFCAKFLERSKKFNPSLKTTNPPMKLFGLTTISIGSDLVVDMLKKQNMIPEHLENGLFIWKVLDKSCAKINGLEPGDIITRINGIPVLQPQDVYKVFTGSSVKFDIIHQGKMKEIFVNVKAKDKNE